ncbi:hypothetical protein TWF281_006345 [Arthrobotrys megalospora]
MVTLRGRLIAPSILLIAKQCLRLAAAVPVEGNRVTDLEPVDDLTHNEFYVSQTGIACDKPFESRRKCPIGDGSTTKLSRGYTDLKFFPSNDLPEEILAQLRASGLCEETYSCLCFESKSQLHDHGHPTTDLSNSPNIRKQVYQKRYSSGTQNGNQRNAPIESTIGDTVCQWYKISGAKETRHLKSRDRNTSPTRIAVAEAGPPDRVGNQKPEPVYTKGTISKRGAPISTPSVSILESKTLPVPQTSAKAASTSTSVKTVSPSPSMPPLNPANNSTLVEAAKLETSKRVTGHTIFASRVGIQCEQPEEVVTRTMDWYRTNRAAERPIDWAALAGSRGTAFALGFIRNILDQCAQCECQFGEEHGPNGWGLTASPGSDCTQAIAGTCEELFDCHCVEEWSARPGWQQDRERAVLHSLSRRPQTLSNARFYSTRLNPFVADDPGWPLPNGPVHRLHPSHPLNRPGASTAVVQAQAEEEAAQEALPPQYIVPDGEGRPPITLEGPDNLTEDDLDGDGTRPGRSRGVRRVLNFFRNGRGGGGGGGGGSSSRFNLFKPRPDKGLKKRQESVGTTNPETDPDTEDNTKPVT